MTAAPPPAPAGADDRASVARLPAAAFFGFLLVGQLTLAAALQIASIPFGLVFSEVFVFAAPALLLALAAGYRPASLLGLRWPGGALVGLGAAAGAANFLAAGALQVAARSLVPPELARRFDAAYLFQGIGGGELAALVVALGLVAPLCEEIAFRGYLQRVLASRGREAAAVAVTALLFSVLHLDPIGFVARVELGVLFGLLALWTRSLWPAVAAHAANNLIAAGLLVVALQRGPAAASRPSGGLLQALGLGLLGLAGAALALAAIRRLSRGVAEPALESRAGDGEHDLRAGRAAGPLLAWLGGGLAYAILVFALGWTTAQVNFADAATPVRGLERRLPDDGARRAFTLRVQAERRRARDGATRLEDYRALRRRLADLDKAQPADAGVTLGQIEAAIAGAPDAGP